MKRCTERTLTTHDQFSSFASAEPEVHPSVVWTKSQAMAEGEELASKQLSQQAPLPNRRPSGGAKARTDASTKPQSRR